MKVKVDVTWDDIEKCETNDGERCAVRRALARVLPPGSTVRVSPDYVEIGLDGDFDLILVPLPNVATEFISTLDRGLLVAPFSFVLDLPERFRTAA